MVLEGPRVCCFFQSQEGNNKQAAKLLEFLLRGRVDVVDKLVYSLRSEGQSELAKTCLRDPKKADEWSSDEDEEEEEENQETSAGTVQLLGKNAIGDDFS